MIAVDFDNTIADSMTALWDHRPIWDIKDELAGVPATVINVKWDFAEYFPIGASGRMWHYFNYAEDLLRDTPPIPGANAGLRTLVEQGASLMLVSDRPRHHLEWLLDWLDTHDFPPMMAVTTGCDNGRTKQEIASRYRTKVAIDDAPHHIRDYLEMGVHVLAPRYPYNHQEQQLTTSFGAWTDLTDAHLARIAEVSRAPLYAL